MTTGPRQVVSLAQLLDRTCCEFSHTTGMATGDCLQALVICAANAVGNTSKTEKDVREGVTLLSDLLLLNALHSFTKRKTKRKH